MHPPSHMRGCGWKLGCVDFLWQFTSYLEVLQLPQDMEGRALQASCNTRVELRGTIADNLCFSNGSPAKKCKVDSPAPDAKQQSSLRAPARTCARTGSSKEVAIFPPGGTSLHSTFLQRLVRTRPHRTLHQSFKVLVKRKRASPLDIAMCGTCCKTGEPGAQCLGWNLFLIRH